MTTRRVLLVNPPETSHKDFSSPPLGLLYLAGTLKAGGHEVRLADGYISGWDGVRASISGFKPEVVGITCLTAGRKKALACARLAKELAPGCTVVLGGVHPTLMSRQLLETYPEVDLAVLGEGERTLLEIVDGVPPEKIAGLAYRAASGEVRESLRQTVENLDTLAMPAWELVAHTFGRYPSHATVESHNGLDLRGLPRISVVFSRGCTGHCDFCSTWSVWRGWRRRSPGNMADELERLYREFGMRHFCFADDAFTVDKAAAGELCDEIVRRGLKIAFFATTRADCVDQALLAKMKAAGCYEVSYGIETASPDLLRRLRKEEPAEAAAEAIKMTKQAGLRACALLITGSAGETEATVDETVEFLRRADPDGLGLAGGLWVFPGTALYGRLKKEGYIDDNYWLGDEPYLLYTAEHRPRRLRLFAHALRARVKLSEMGPAYRLRFYASDALDRMRDGLAGTTLLKAGFEGMLGLLLPLARRLFPARRLRKR